VYNCRVFEAKEEEIPAVNVDSAWAKAMNKRILSSSFSAVMARPAISPLLAWATKDKLKNWRAISNTGLTLVLRNSLKRC